MSYRINGDSARSELEAQADAIWYRRYELINPPTDDEIQFAIAAYNMLQGTIEQHEWRWIAWPARIRLLTNRLYLSVPDPTRLLPDPSRLGILSQTSQSESDINKWKAVLLDLEAKPK